MRRGKTKTFASPPEPSVRTDGDIQRIGQPRHGASAKYSHIGAKGAPVDPGSLGQQGSRNLARRQCAGISGGDHPSTYTST